MCHTSALEAVEVWDKETFYSREFTLYVTAKPCTRVVVKLTLTSEITYPMPRLHDLCTLLLSQVQPSQTSPLVMTEWDKRYPLLV